MSIHDDIDHVIITEDRIAERIPEMGAQIRDDYADARRPLLLVAVLRGAALFVADLSRAIEAGSSSTSWRSPATARPRSRRAWSAS